MKKSIIKITAIAAAFFTALILFSSCSKTDTSIAVPGSASNQQYFEDTVLEHDLVISAASTDGTDITSQFSKYTFRFSRTSTLSGTVLISNTEAPLTALWSIDAGYSHLTISISPSPAPFDFLNDAFIFSGRATTNFTLATLNKPNKNITFTKL